MAAGLLVVAMFLIVYYRVLGVIATAALAVYALYFYALIKLIPITLTLPGIAGLILTIGVAADANIVIFERVKEEIRAGRSIRAGIATGYRKGLTAIIDANVVTIMTAFILFVLATAEVQGFAFTLGHRDDRVAVHGRAGHPGDPHDDERLAHDRRPSALGRGRQARAWTFDFMGASRYFFSMSGVILLIGALAIGGRGLNLGHRLHLGHADHRLAGQAGDAGPGRRTCQRRRRRQPRGPEGRQQGPAASRSPPSNCSPPRRHRG